MASNRRHLTRRASIAIALAVGFVACLSLGAAFAAVLVVGSAPIGVGAVDADCQSVGDGAIVPSYEYSYRPTQPGYAITGVTLSNIASTCGDRAVHVVLAASSGAQVTEGSGSTPHDSSTVTIPLTTPIPVTDVLPVQLTVLVVG
jgi:hypothetical protein